MNVITRLIKVNGIFPGHYTSSTASSASNGNHVKRVILHWICIIKIIDDPRHSSVVAAAAASTTTTLTTTAAAAILIHFFRNPDVANKLDEERK